MPIYAYRCASCGHSRDVLQKMSDPVLTTCPVCGAEQFQKQVTAAGFQLKGSGWYATDFKGGNAPVPAAAAPGDAAGAVAPAAPATASAPSTDGGAKAAPPAAAAAAAPSSGSQGGSSSASH